MNENSFLNHILKLHWTDQAAVVDIVSKIDINIYFTTRYALFLYYSR